MNNGKQSTDLVLRTAQEHGFTETAVELIRNTAARGRTDEEIAQLLIMAHKTGLDPLARQIYMIGRYDSRAGREVATPQTSIDGYRLIADRTERYAPGRESTYTYDEDGLLVSATAYVKKLVAGTWHEVAATAFWDEYKQTNKQGNPTALWAKMPHVMLAKCFDEETEVLTEEGFQRFSELSANVLQVFDGELQPVRALAYSQEWHGDMVTLDSDDLNFCVTPNHDMVTTEGKIEAGEMYELARSRPKFWIPRTVPNTNKDVALLRHPNLILAAAYIADGYDTGDRTFKIKVSRAHKIDTIDHLYLHKDKAIRAVAGQTAETLTRTITTQSDQTEYLFNSYLVAPLCYSGKRIDTTVLLQLSRSQARVFVDALVAFDGHTQKKSGVRRFYTSRLDHLAAFEVACAVAGYSVSPRRERQSDIGGTNYYVTISDRSEIPVIRWGREYNNLDNEGEKQRTGLTITQNTSGRVWCVTVPSGVIIVRHKGFSMVCGNCAEALALRRAFPAELSGLYTAEEMAQASQEEVIEATVAPVVERALPAVSEPEPEPTTCDVCDGVMEAVEWADGTRWSAQEMIDYTREHHERTLCLSCFSKEKGWEQA